MQTLEMKDTDLFTFIERKVICKNNFFKKKIIKVNIFFFLVKDDSLKQTKREQ